RSCALCVLNLVVKVQCGILNNWRRHYGLNTTLSNSTTFPDNLVQICTCAPIESNGSQKSESKQQIKYSQILLVRR
ncbi:hypothetical protein M5D96_005833, partial [Drosophila gunungcola]